MEIPFCYPENPSWESLPGKLLLLLRPVVLLNNLPQRKLRNGAIRQAMTASKFINHYNSPVRSYMIDVEEKPSKTN